jgi:hypothetical protein
LSRDAGKLSSRIERECKRLRPILTAFSALAFADNWQGRLVDASCYQQQKSATSCDPSSATTSFILFVADTPYALDVAGNQKATAALKARADRSSDPTKPPSTQVIAKITGTKDAGNSLKVDTIELQ